MTSLRDIKAEMTKVVYDILEKNNIKCFLTGGSLLGAYRDGGELPTAAYPGGNFNIDEKDLRENFSTLKKQFADIGLNVTHGKKKRTFTIFVKWSKGIHCELIGYYKDGDMYYRRALLLKVIPAEYFEKPFTQIKLMGNYYPAPYDIESYLEWLYGDWKIKRDSIDATDFKSKKHLRPLP